MPARASRRLRIAAAVASRPTATRLEHAPAQAVRDFVRRTRGLSLDRDEYGNLVVRYPARKRPSAPPLVMVAHLDHPGFAVMEAGAKEAELEFRGGVMLPHARPGTALEFFAKGGRLVGRGVLRKVDGKEGPGGARLAGGEARITSGRAAADGFAMWALTPFAVRRGIIVGRALDDLLGVAAALATMEEIARARPRGAHVWAVLTRAEETGFHGTLAAIRARTIPKRARVLSLETSRALPHAPMGGGVIVRVGDARSLFDAPLMHALHAEAKALAAADRKFRFQRRLMDGGSCEATAFCSAGYRAGGLCVPLGNYHNMKGLDGGPKGIAAEEVRVSDFDAEVDLLVRLATDAARLRAAERDADRWLKPAMTASSRMLAKEPLRLR